MRWFFLMFSILIIFAFSGVFALSEVVNVEDNVGGLYELEEFDEGIKVFTDRDHLFKTVPEKYIGATYIRCPVASVREKPEADITVEIDSPMRIYILWYTEDKWEAAKPSPPTDWLKQDYEMTEDVVIWGPDLGFNPWKSKKVFPEGEFHTYTTGNDCAYGVFAIEERSAVEPLGDKISIRWGEIKR